MSRLSMLQQVQELEKQMDDAFAAYEAAKAAGDYAEANAQHALAIAYRSRLNRKKLFLQR